MPKDYKGPVTGYYEQVNKYFDKKRDLMNGVKVDAIPKINDYPEISKSRD